MEELLPAVAMAALLWKIVDFLKYCMNWNSGGKNGAVSQLVIWIGGIVVVLLFAKSDWASAVKLGGLTLDKMNLWSQLAAGLSLGGVTSVGFDVKKALDPSDSAKMPPLLDGLVDPPAGASEPPL